MVKQWLNAGVLPTTSGRKAGYIRASNLTAMLIAAWLGSLVLGTGWFFFQYSPDLVVANFVAALIILSAIAWNARGWYTASNLVCIVACLAVVTFNALHFGRDSWNHLFLLATVLISFQYVESSKLLVATSVAGVLLFLSVEIWYAGGNPSLMQNPTPPLAFEVAKYGSIYNLVFLTIATAFSNRNLLNRVQRALDDEKRRSEELLLNILPAPVAERLKLAPGAIADRIPEASILFADIAGFTPLARTMDAGALVTMLNQIFIGFDRAAKRLGLEKIKTIGDAYMVAAGLPEPRADHAQACLGMAKAMLAHMDEVRKSYPTLQVRIGIHTGSVVAGVIGESKFNYDLWGDVVNLASRMESHGVPGRIHVSHAFRTALGPEVEVEDRGIIDVKGQEPQRTFLVL